MHCKTGAARRNKSWLLGTVCVAMAGPPSAAFAQDMLGRPVVIVPTVGLQETYTDNAALTDQGRESDFITRFNLGSTAAVDHGRLTAHVNVQGWYDLYAKHPNFNGWSIAGDATANYAIVRDRLSIEAAGNVSEASQSLFNGSAIDRSGTPGRTRVGIFYLGPKLTTDINNFAQLTADARIGVVNYSDADNSVEIAPLPSNATFYQALFRLDTGERVRPYQLLTASLLQADDSHYRSANLIQSVYYRVSPLIRLIGRAGYEAVRQQGLQDINSPVLSVGMEFRPNDVSRIRIEGGERFNRGAWAARADLRIAPRFMLFGRHSELVATDQLHVANDFDEFITQSQELPAPTISRAFQFNQNLYNQTSFNKLTELRLEYNGPVNFVALSTTYSERRFLGPVASPDPNINDTNSKDRSLDGNISVTRHVRPDLNVTLSGHYTRTFESPLYGASKTYGADLLADYAVNSTVELQVGYSYRTGSGNDQSFIGQDFGENVAFVSIQKTF